MTQMAPCAVGVTEVQTITSYVKKTYNVIRDPTRETGNKSNLEETETMQGQENFNTITPLPSEEREDTTFKKQNKVVSQKKKKKRGIFRVEKKKILKCEI